MEFLGQATGNDGWYGRGFYFSTLPAYCHHYQVNDYLWFLHEVFFVLLSSILQPHRVTNKGAGSISIIAAWVLLGRPHVMHRTFFLHLELLYLFVDF